MEKCYITDLSANHRQPIFNDAVHSSFLCNMGNHRSLIGSTTCMQVLIQYMFGVAISDGILVTFSTAVFKLISGFVKSCSAVLLCQLGKPIFHV